MTALAQELRRRESFTEFPAGFAEEALRGLTSNPKSLPAKYFYDVAGSDLFEQITRLPEYYLTRTELGILRDRGREIAGLIAPGGVLIEFGSGSSAKIRALLRATPLLGAYVPVDISAEFLAAEVKGLRSDFPRLKILPIAADFTRAFEVPPALHTNRRTGFFPGSTIGNFEPETANAFLRQAGQVLGEGATLIVGVDLVKSAKVLNAAYNDSQGVTARFNLNVLERLNRELAADFDLDAFAHRAFFNPALSRIEMHLVSQIRQHVRLCDEIIEFAAGETIHTENSYKYSLASFRDLARAAGWTPQQVWTDAQQHFSIHALVRGAD